MYPESDASIQAANYIQPITYHVNTRFHQAHLCMHVIRAGSYSCCQSSCWHFHFSFRLINPNLIVHIFPFFPNPHQLFSSSLFWTTQFTTVGFSLFSFSSCCCYSSNTKPLNINAETLKCWHLHFLPAVHWITRKKENCLFNFTKLLISAELYLDE